LRPIREINFYAYVLNNPINHNDPSGLILNVDPDLQPALMQVRSTPRGDALYHQLQDDPFFVYTIKSVPGLEDAGILMPKSKPFTVFIDPNWHPDTCSPGGLVPASTARILGHEMGHLANLHDDGPGQMNNVLINENPIAAALNPPEPPRIQYRPLPCKKK